MNSKEIGVYILAVAVVLLAVVTAFKPTIEAQPQTANLGSVPIANEYQGTTTSQTRFSNEQLIKATGGVLGSVIVTGAAAGVVNFYDATTSDATQRAPSMSTSSILVASLPASTAAGTYTFDRALFYGLYVSIVGTIPTTTITYR